MHPVNAWFDGGGEGHAWPQSLAGHAWMITGEYDRCSLSFCP